MYYYPTPITGKMFEIRIEVTLMPKQPTDIYLSPWSDNRQINENIDVCLNLVEINSRFCLPHQSIQFSIFYYYCVCLAEYTTYTHGSI